MKSYLRNFLLVSALTLSSASSIASIIMNAGDSALFVFDLNGEPNSPQWVFGSGLGRIDSTPIDLNATEWQFFANADGTGRTRYIGYIGTRSLNPRDTIDDGVFSARLTIGEATSAAITSTMLVNPYIITSFNGIRRFDYSSVTITRAVADVSAPITIGIFGIGLSFMWLPKIRAIIFN